MAENIVFGEAPVVSRAGTGHASLEEVIAIGRRVWKRIDAAKVSPQDEAACDKLLEEIQTEFHDFNTSFPLVVRWAVQLHKFSSSAFEKYLRLHASADLSSRESFLKLQAEYLVLLFREENARHHDEKAVQAYRNEIIKRLLEEDKAFQELRAEAEAEAAQQAAAVNSQRRQKLFEFLSARSLAQKTKDESAQKE